LFVFFGKLVIIGTTFNFTGWQPGYVFIFSEYKFLLPNFMGNKLLTGDAKNMTSEPTDYKKNFLQNLKRKY
jgi:hypothetical protein